MTNNNQPFVPPLTAEERGLWDRVFVEAFRSYEPNTWLSCANYADGAITERRRRFGVPGPTAQDLCAQELFRKVCDKSEIDTLRAEVERLTKERDELRRSSRIDASEVDDLLDERNAERARAEKAEAELAAARPVLEAVEEWFEAHSGPWVSDVANTLQSYADAQRGKAVSVPGARLIEERDRLRAELESAKPVLEAVVRWFSERAWTVKDADTLRDYAMSQRAARAAKSPDATNDTNGGM